MRIPFGKMIACVTRGLLTLIYRTSHKNNDKSYQNISECNNNCHQNSKKAISNVEFKILNHYFFK